ncbi:hypothetical protein [Streptomyces sp. x-80]|uniref:hypothetical protein n=1 Tax=Streptomyces sp. x-80 TaxID=2789282 RepID=UPI003980D2F7
MKTHRMQLAMVAGLSSLALFTAACSSGGSDETATGSSQDTGAEQAKMEDCLRDKGVKIDKGGDGRAGGMVLPDGMGPEEFKKLQKECGAKDLADGAGGGEEISQADKDKALAFAACMRKEGVDMADPEFGEGGLSMGRIDPEVADSEEFKKATKKCNAAREDK